MTALGNDLEAKLRQRDHRAGKLVGAVVGRDGVMPVLGDATIPKPDDTLHRLKCVCQDLLRDDFLCWIGAGLSAAEGLPTMQALAETLREQLPLKALAPDSRVTWEKIAEDLDGLGLALPSQSGQCT